MSNTVLAVDYIDRKTDHTFHLPISVFKKPNNDKEYSKLEKILDTLIDEVRGDEKHPLALAMQIIGDNLEQYDNEFYPDIGENVSDIDMVKYLMQQRNLRQVDLADIFGGQANVSNYLSGKRPLSKNQIAGLKKRFGVSADFFV
jgi:HTH-type transcriptional regulator/antitoxin HigA